MPPIRFKDISQIPESTYAPEIAMIVNSVEQTVKASYEKERQRRAVRFAHAKSYGIVRASVKIESGLAPEYAQGIYATPATYEAVIRFSNGLGHLGPDAMLGPIFGTGLKFFRVPGHSLIENESGVSNFDYAMINAPTFFANTAKDYVVIERLFDALPAPLMDPRTAKTWLHDFLTREGTLPPDQWLWDELFAVMALGKTPWRNPLLSSYWTQGAVRHGEYVAKLRLSPEPSAAAQVRIRDLNPLTNPEAVRDSLVAEIGEHDYSFELQAQLCVDPLRMPIQNTSIEWSEMLSPFTKIAIIHIPKQDISSPANLDVADRISISPWRTRDDHVPMGEIMTLRREVYRRSAEVRRQINQQPQKEPSSPNELIDQQQRA
ncbi:MAG: catalase family protein [Candidatus Acidiferrales bacterium]